MRQRFLDVSFDANGYPKKQFLGQVIRNSEGVNVIRVTIDQPRMTANMMVSFERPDGEIGSGMMSRKYNDPKTVFTYVLNSWITALRGELKMSFSLLYSDPLKGEEIVNDTAVQIYPVDTLRMVTIGIEDSIGEGDPIGDSPNVTGQVWGEISEIKEDIKRLDDEQDDQDDKIIELQNKECNLDMGIWTN